MSHHLLYHKKVFKLNLWKLLIMLLKLLFSRLDSSYFFCSPDRSWSTPNVWAIRDHREPTQINRMYRRLVYLWAASNLLRNKFNLKEKTSIERTRALVIKSLTHHNASNNSSYVCLSHSGVTNRGIIKLIKIKRHIFTKNLLLIIITCPCLSKFVTPIFLSGLASAENKECSCVGNWPRQGLWHIGSEMMENGLNFTDFDSPWDSPIMAMSEFDKNVLEPVSRSIKDLWSVFTITSETDSLGVSCEIWVLNA